MAGSRTGHARSRATDTRSRLVAAAGRRGLTVAGLLIAALLVVVLYYPVGTVLAEALTADGRLSLGPLLAVLQDPFYVGALSGLFVNPGGVPAGIGQWIRTAMKGDLVFPPFGLFGFTAWQALLSTLASLALGLPGAYVLARFEFPGRRTVKSLTAVPFVLPSIMVAVGFVTAFGKRGPINDTLTTLGLPGVDLVFTLELIVLAHAFYNAPLVTRIVAAAWENVDGRAVETARSLGASQTRAFRDVVAPQLYPAALTAALLTFIFTFMSFPIVLALGGLELATVEVWLFDRVQDLRLTEAAALAVLEAIVSLSLTYVYLRYETTRRGTGSTSGASDEPLDREPLFGPLTPKRIGIAVYGAVVAVVVVLPVVSMLVESVTAGDGGLTLRWYRFLVEQQTSGRVVGTRPLPAVRNSLVFGAGTLLIAVPIGVVVAVATNRDSALARLLGTATMLPFAISGIVVGFGLLQGLVFGIDLFGTRLRVTGPVAIVAAHAVAAYPFVTRNVAPALSDLDARLRESARALGASRGRALVDVELPLVAPGIAAGAAFAFAISIGEFDSTIILAEGSAAYTMPVAVERYLTDRTLGPATAMGTVLLVVTAASFVVIDRVGGRYG